MESSAPTLEGRLNAQREILIALVAQVMLHPDAGPGLIRSLEEEVLAQDGSEDPGATPSAGLARTGEKSAEIREILETAKARASAIRRTADRIADL
ncbi:hypothetical protein [Rhizobium sp. AAP43]|uniref:hypothetical protein n=1 Tax=Rhizobium sp. AAP43 TaxID=1523420 RepID=UPI0006B8A6A3|nr:hypothetical protein [Rhizobium sp. AAP43]KPF42081.1 hypothetical protein IP76_18435 [Rhizobium sp. AAP43]